MSAIADWLTPRGLQAHDIYPLRESVFEGQIVKVPHSFAKLLTKEYGKTSLTMTRYSK